jgi:hypothetical protein
MVVRFCLVSRRQNVTKPCGARGFLHFVGVGFETSFASRLLVESSILLMLRGSQLSATLFACFGACRLWMAREFAGNSRSRGDKTGPQFVSFYWAWGTNQVLPWRSWRSRRSRRGESCPQIAQISADVSRLGLQSVFICGQLFFRGLRIVAWLRRRPVFCKASGCRDRKSSCFAQGVKFRSKATSYLRPALRDS